jgi:hypothetical protein
MLKYSSKGNDPQAHQEAVLLARYRQQGYTTPRTLAELWEAVVTARMAGGKTRYEALVDVRRTDQALHIAYSAQCRAAARRRR